MFLGDIPGGRLFEFYLENLATPTSHGVWKNFAKATRLARDDEFGANDDELHFGVDVLNMFATEKPRFVGFVINALANISSKCKKQQFYMTASARFHGLSRYGVAQLAQLGSLQRLTLHDTHTREANERALATLRQPQHNCHVMFLQMIEQQPCFFLSAYKFRRL